MTYIITRKTIMPEIHKVFFDKEKAEEYIKPLNDLYKDYLNLMKNADRYDFVIFYYLHNCLLYEITKYDDDFKYGRKDITNVKFFPRYEMVEKEVQ